MQSLEAFFQFWEKYPAFGSVLMACIVWPTITMGASFAQDSIKARWPRVWDLLSHNGFDFLGFIRKVWPKRLPPPPKDNQ